jgi:hypothetical protein
LIYLPVHISISDVRWTGGSKKPYVCGDLLGVRPAVSSRSQDWLEIAHI